MTKNKWRFRISKWSITDMNAHLTHIVLSFSISFSYFLGAPILLHIFLLFHSGIYTLHCLNACFLYIFSSIIFCCVFFIFHLSLSPGPNGEKISKIKTAKLFIYWWIDLLIIWTLSVSALHIPYAAWKYVVLSWQTARTHVRYQNEQQCTVKIEWEKQNTIR